MNRRSFIGSVIGMAAALQFKALLPDDQIQMPSKLPFRMLFKGNGHIIQAPGIKELVQKDFRFTFVCEPLHATKTLVVDRCILLDKNDKVIRESVLDFTAHLCSWDTLNVSQSFDCFERIPKEQFIEILNEGKFNVC